MTTSDLTRNEGRAIWKMGAALGNIYEELMDNGGEVTEEISEQLVALGDMQGEIADGMHALVARVEQEKGYLSEEIARLQALKRTRDNALQGIKDYLLRVMKQGDIKKIEGNLGTITMAAGRESVSCDTAALLAPHQPAVDAFREHLPSYMKVELSIDKTELLKALKEGKQIVQEGEGTAAEIVRNPYLLIR